MIRRNAWQFIRNVFVGIAVGIALAITVLALYRFAAALIGATTEGEIAGALGSLVGGIVGAGGAMLAVYLALSSQRKEETAKVAVGRQN
jgi:hypothetical protein